jgi:hypothetical protein
MSEDKRTADENVDTWIVHATVIYWIAMCFVGLLLAASGGTATLYALIACCTVLTALYSSRARRIWAVAATLLAIAMAIRDHEKGRTFDRALLRTYQNMYDKEVEKNKQPKRIAE